MKIGLKHLDIFPFIAALRKHISGRTKEETQKDFLALQTPKMDPNRRMCNELVWELCKEIPIVKTSERILLTAHKMYAYLVPRFRKMRMIYRDAIAFLKAMMEAKKNVQIQIDEVEQNNESEPIIRKKQSEDGDEIIFELQTQTNKFRVKIRRSCHVSRNEIFIFHRNGQFECAHLQHFLRLIVPLIQPIKLYCCFSSKPNGCFMPILNALNGCIDKICLTPEQFNSPVVDEALAKYNSLLIYFQQFSTLTVDVPKLVQWLTTSNNKSGQSKKYLTLWGPGMTDVTPFLDKVKEDFGRAASKCRFVVRLISDKSLAKFTLCNKLTGEKLQLRRTGVKGCKLVHALSRRPNNELANNVNDCAGLDTGGVIGFLTKNGIYWTRFNFISL